MVSRVPRRVRRLATVLAVAAAGAAGAAACTDVSSDPDAPFSIEILPTELPSLVKDDSLRSSTGEAVPVRAIVRNAKNKIIADAPVRFVKIARTGTDTGAITIDRRTGMVTGNDTGTTFVLAQVGGLQTEAIAVHVSFRPVKVFQVDEQTKPVTSSDTTLLEISTNDTSAFLGVRLLGDIAGTDTQKVANYLVRFRIIEPAGISPTDTSAPVRLVGDGGRLASADTSSAQGVAALTLVTHGPTNRYPDLVVVEATTNLPDATPVPGSPIRFVVRIRCGNAVCGTTPPAARHSAR